MKTVRECRPSPALAISFVALVVALGGTSYAAFALPRNSVGTKQIKDGAVTTGKIRNRAITASKLNTSGLTIPSALHAKSADTAGSATNATNATNAINADHARTADSATNATDATTATTAADANTLGGSPSSAFERAGNILTAVVTNNGTTATVVRGTATPNAAAVRNGTGRVGVFFGVNVSSCTWIATQGPPAAAAVPAIFATVRGVGGNEIEVDTWSTAGTLADANFHLLVVC